MMAQLTAVFLSGRVGVDCWIHIKALELQENRDCGAP